MPEDPLGLPEGAVETARITVVGYMHHGGSNYVLLVDGAAHTSELVGLLEMAKHDVLLRNDRTAEGGD